MARCGNGKRCLQIYSPLRASSGPVTDGARFSLGVLVEVIGRIWATKVVHTVRLFAGGWLEAIRRGVLRLQDGELDEVSVVRSID